MLQTWKLVNVESLLALIATEGPTITTRRGQKKIVETAAVILEISYVKQIADVWVCYC